MKRRIFLQTTLTALTRISHQADRENEDISILCPSININISLAKAQRRQERNIIGFTTMGYNFAIFAPWRESFFLDAHYLVHTVAQEVDLSGKTEVFPILLRC